MKTKQLVFALTASMVLGLLTYAQATVLDFQDNVASPPGLYGYVYYNNYTAGRLTDPTGKKVFDLDLSLSQVFLKPLYYTRLWNRTFAVGAAVPLGTVKARNGLGDKENSSGFGDIVMSLGVFLYENNQTATYLSFWENVSIPTGSWSETRARRGGPNLGTHFWFLQHQLAFAQLINKGKYSIDTNLTYYQKFEEPRLDVRVGDSMEIEGIAGYGITDKWRTGIYVDYWTDIKDTRIDGTKIDNSKRKFFGIGPSLTYGTEKWAIHFRFIPDMWAENSTKGYNTWLRVLYSF